MDHKKMVDVKHRIEMLKIASNGDGRIMVSDYEVTNQLGGTTFHTINKLIHDIKYDYYRFAFVIGQDRANTIDTWYNSEELIKMISFIVIPRKGIQRNLNVDWYLKEPHHYIVTEDKIPIDNCSSTKARTLLNESSHNIKEIENIIGEDVYKYIINNKLKFD